MSHVRKGNMFAVRVDALRSTRAFHAARNEERGPAPPKTGQPRPNLEFNASPVSLSKNNRHMLGGCDLKASFDENKVAAAATEIQQQTSRGLLAAAGEATETASPFAVEFCSGTGGLTAQESWTGRLIWRRPGTKPPIVEVGYRDTRWRRTCQVLHQ